MTVFYENLLNNLRSSVKADHSAYYLFLLGTDINFVQVPDQKEIAPYIRGETFSYLAQAVTKLMGETGVVQTNHTNKANKHYAHAYHAPSVDLLNGPDTFGSEAGDRIAKGLLLSLQAIANGQTDLNLSGFSRGAVEAIMLTHELKRVKTTLAADISGSPKKKLIDILKESTSVPGISIINDPSYTREALTRLLDTKIINEDEESLKMTLLEGLDKVKINLFLLDPVPGGNYAKFPIGWNEENFYTLPDFVTKKLELVQQHETSNCFKVIIPQGTPYEIIPGSHGTGDGNQFDNNGNVISSEKKDVSAVQDLVIQRWLEFMSLNIDENKMPGDLTNLVPKHEALNAVTHHYLTASPKQRDALLLASYQKILDNYPAFIFLASKCYKPLGQYFPVRHVHFHKRGGIPMSDIHQQGIELSFVNTQHVKMWISQKINEFNFFEKPFDEQISWLKNNVDYVFGSVSKVENSEIDLSNSTQPKNNQLQTIFNMTEQQEQAVLLNEAFATMNNTLIMTYLRNHLNERDLKIHHDYFAHTLEILSAARVNNEFSENKRNVALKFKSAIEMRIANNLLQHGRDLMIQTQQLIEDSNSLLSENLHESEINYRIDVEQMSITLYTEWFINVQKVIFDLKNFTHQFDRLINYCDKDDLLNLFQELINTSFYGHKIENIIDLSHKLNSMINQSVNVLKFQVAALMETNDDFLNHLHEGMDLNLFQEIRHLAKGMGAVLAEDMEAMHTEQNRHQTQLNQMEQKIIDAEKNSDLLVSQLELAKGMGAVLAEDMEAMYIEQNRHQTQLNQMEQKIIDAEKNSDLLVSQLKNEITFLSDLSQKWQSLSEQQALKRIIKLQEKTDSYLNHLHEQKSNKSILDQKKVTVLLLKSILDDWTLLPSIRLQSFQCQLNDAAELLKKERNPKWQCFIVDCLRILGLLISGIAFYRLAQGTSLQFFQPNKGTAFVTETKSLIDSVASEQRCNAV